jgi:monofunctional biosynthetic peptidoglycan transglycosylase
MKRILRFILKTLLWTLVISIFWVFLYRWVPVPVTPLMLIRAFKQNEVSSNMYWEHEWVPITQISKNMQLAVICSEDQLFLEHNGFDLKAIKIAIEANRNGNKIRGASTISQQTAKNVFLWPDRNWLRKGLEAYFTFLIEALWPKERILEVYLNSIEMGKNIYGIEAASQYWFQKNAKTLTKEESAAIAAILPNPRVYKASPPTNYIKKRKSWILRQIQNFGPLEFNRESNKISYDQGTKN